MIGEVVGIHIRDDVIGADGKIDIKKVRPLARLGYMDYTSVTEVFTMEPQGNAGRPDRRGGGASKRSWSERDG